MVKQLALRLWRILMKVTVRRASRSRLLIKVSALRRLRRQFDLPLPGDDKSLDASLGQVVDEFFDHGQVPASVVESDESWDWARCLQEDPTSLTDRRDYLRLSHWLLDGVDADRVAQILLLYRSLYDEDLAPVTDQDVHALYISSRKRSRIEAESLRESKASRLGVGPKEVVLQIVPWLSVLFVVSGYIHARVVYGYFGVDVSRFFSIPDYLADSIGEIDRALLMLGFFGWGSLSAYRASTTRGRYEAEAREKRLRRSDIAVYVLLSLMWLAWYQNDALGLWPLLPMTLVAIGASPTGSFVARHFESPLSGILIVMSAVVFLSSGVASALDRIEAVVGDTEQVPFRISVEAESRRSIVYHEQTSRFVGANSRYVFLLDESENVEIVPLGRVKRLWFAKDESSWLRRMRITRKRLR